MHLKLPACQQRNAKAALAPSPHHHPEPLTPQTAYFPAWRYDSISHVPRYSIGIVVYAKGRTLSSPRARSALLRLPSALASDGAASEAAVKAAMADWISVSASP